MKYLLVALLLFGCASSPAIIDRIGECEAIIYLESMHPNNISKGKFKKFEEEFTVLMDSMIAANCEQINISYKAKDALKGD